MGDTRLEPLVLSEDERRGLENWAKRRSTAQGLALRARIVLACAQGGSNVSGGGLGTAAASPVAFLSDWSINFTVNKVDVTAMTDRSRDRHYPARSR